MKSKMANAKPTWIQPNKCCRICLTNDLDAGLMNLFVSPTLEDNMYSKKIELAFGIKVVPNDMFPQFICSKCMVKVDAALDTKEMILKTEKENFLASIRMSDLTFFAEPEEQELSEPEPELEHEVKVEVSRWNKPVPEDFQPSQWHKDYCHIDFKYDIDIFFRQRAVLRELRVGFAVRARKALDAQLKEYCDYRAAHENEDSSTIVADPPKAPITPIVSGIYNRLPLLVRRVKYRGKSLSIRWLFPYERIEAPKPELLEPVIVQRRWKNPVPDDFKPYNFHKNYCAADFKFDNDVIFNGIAVCRELRARYPELQAIKARKSFEKQLKEYCANRAAQEVDREAQSTAIIPFEVPTCRGNKFPKGFINSEKPFPPELRTVKPKAAKISTIIKEPKMPKKKKPKKPVTVIHLRHEMYYNY